MPPTEITREQWIEETERLCPSDRAFDAYVALEEVMCADTDLDVSYMSVSRGKSDYCTFSAANESLIEAFEEFRTTLNGVEGKGWETVKVLRLGEETVQEAVVKLAEKIVPIVKACTADAK